MTQAQWEGRNRAGGSSHGGEVGCLPVGWMWPQMAARVLLIHEVASKEEGILMGLRGTQAIVQVPVAEALVVQRCCEVAWN